MKDRQLCLCPEKYKRNDLYTFMHDFKTNYSVTY